MTQQTTEPQKESLTDIVALKELRHPAVNELVSTVFDLVTSDRLGRIVKRSSGVTDPRQKVMHGAAGMVSELNEAFLAHNSKTFSEQIGDFLWFFRESLIGLEEAGHVVSGSDEAPRIVTLWLSAASKIAEGNNNVSEAALLDQAKSIAYYGSDQCLAGKLTTELLRHCTNLEGIPDKSEVEMPVAEFLYFVASDMLIQAVTGTANMTLSRDIAESATDGEDTAPPTVEAVAAESQAILVDSINMLEAKLLKRYPEGFDKARAEESGRDDNAEAEAMGLSN